MPLGKNVRYRRKGNVRLAFKGNEVVEAKNMKSGATHSPAEFSKDRKKHARKAARVATRGGY